MPVRGPENRELPLLIFGEGVGVGLRAIESDARLQAADNLKRNVVAISSIIGQPARDPEIGQAFQVRIRWKQQFEARREYTDDLGPSAPSGWFDGLAQYGGIATKTTLPIFIAEDGDGGQLLRRGCVCRAGRRRLLRLPVSIFKVASDMDLGAHQSEEVSGYQPDADLLGSAIPPKHRSTKGEDAAEILEGVLGRFA